MLKFGMVPRVVVFSHAYFNLDTTAPQLASPLVPFTGWMHVNFAIDLEQIIFIE